MQRSRLSMFLGAMALVLSGCLTSAPPEGTQREIDEVQRPTSVDETAAADPAPVAAEAAMLDPFEEPCPCDLLICRPVCAKRPVVQLSCTGNPDCNGGPPPAPAPPAEAATPVPSINAQEIEPCPCINPICRPGCTNP